MTKYLTIALALAAGLAVCLQAVGQKDEPEKKARNVLMQAKLKSAQKVLEGVAVGDFALIERNAEELAIISKKAEWQILKTPDYVRFSEEFRRHADAMGDQAKKRNLDAAALAYVQITMDCVNCHKHVREVRVARGEPNPPFSIGAE
jgi:cytochrome c556